MSSHQELLEVANTVSRHLAVEMGVRILSVRFLDSGSTSVVFRVSTSTQDLILKIASNTSDKAASYESDFLIRRSLWKSGGPVALPIAVSSMYAIGVHAQWAIDVHVEGKNPTRGKIPVHISNQLGKVLHRLHSLPVNGFGKLENANTQIRGRANDPLEGLLTRFESPWPFTDQSLSDNPAIQAIPCLEDKLRPLESDLQDFVSGDTCAVVHSDLHEGQVLVEGGELQALLDFNEAISARREWDFGSYLYFHGIGCLNDLLDGYTEDDEDKRNYINGAKLASLLIAMHHANRGKIKHLPYRIQAAAAFLDSALN